MKERLEYVLAGRDELTRPLKQAQGQMKNLERQAQRTNKQMGAFSSNLTGMQKNTRKFAMGSLQQAGFQIGDFAVQVANGTSKMQAFGQQAPQFLQIFGPVGSIVGAAVAIFAAFGVVAQKAGKGTISLSDKVKTLRSSIDELQGVDELLKKNLEAPLIVANAALTSFLTQLRESKMDELLGNVRSAAQTALDPTFDRMDELSSKSRRTRDNINAMIAAGDDPAAIKKLMDRVTLQEAEFKALKNIAETVAYATIADDAEELAQNLLNAREELRKQGVLTDQLDASFTEILRSGDLLAVAMKKQRTVMGTIKDGIEQINKAELYHDRILRQQNITQSNLTVKYNQMVQAQKDRKKFLDDELIVMQQVVKQSGKLLTNMQKFRPDKVYGGRGGDPRKQTADYMNQLGYTSVADLIEELSEKGPKAIAKTREAIIKLSPEAQRMADLGEAIGNSFENAMLSAVDGTMKAKDAFRVMAADIIKELYRVFVVKKITGFIADAISFSAGPKTGNTGSLGLPDFSYNGGGYTGNGARAGGMDGKGGFMAMLHPRETVVDHTRGQGGGVTVVQNINVSTGVQQTVRTEIKSLMPQIAESAKAAVADAKRRGGSYGRAFA